MHFRIKELTRLKREIELMAIDRDNDDDALFYSTVFPNIHSFCNETQHTAYDSCLFFVSYLSLLFFSYLIFIFSFLIFSYLFFTSSWHLFGISCTRIALARFNTWSDMLETTYTHRDRRKHSSHSNTLRYFLFIVREAISIMWSIVLVSCLVWSCSGHIWSCLVLLFLAWCLFTSFLSCLVLVLVLFRFVSVLSCLSYLLVLFLFFYWCPLHLYSCVLLVFPLYFLSSLVERHRHTYPIGKYSRKAMTQAPRFCRKFKVRCSLLAPVVVSALPHILAIDLYITKIDRPNWILNLTYIAWLDKWSYNGLLCDV